MTAVLLWRARSCSRRARRRLAEIEQYETLSAAERAEVDQLRDEHSARRGMSFGSPKIMSV